MSLLHLEDLRLAHGDALVMVDVQNDFVPGGSLAVPRGDEVVPVLRAAAERFRAAGLPVAATRDWHPPDHCSFRPQGGPWPPHCVRGTWGAAWAPGLDVGPGTVVISKATAPERDAYSGFQGTDLEIRLRALGVRHLFVGGLATDYCVLETVRDALERGFAVSLLGDAVRPVEVLPGDGARATAAMRTAGAVEIEAGPHRSWRSRPISDRRTSC